MKTMEKLCKRFERIHKDYTAWFDTLESYPGFYRVVITEPVCGLSTTYTFETCKDFVKWMDGVVLD